MRALPVAARVYAHWYFVVKIIRVLGEGGFSFVYLAQDEHSGVRHVAFGTFLRYSRRAMI